MSINVKVTSSNQSWNCENLIKLSDNIDKAYNLGLNKINGNCQGNSWNAEKFINLSCHLSSVYGVDF